MHLPNSDVVIFFGVTYIHQLILLQCAWPRDEDREILHSASYGS